MRFRRQDGAIVDSRRRLLIPYTHFRILATPYKPRFRLFVLKPRFRPAKLVIGLPFFHFSVCQLVFVNLGLYPHLLVIWDDEEHLGAPPLYRLPFRTPLSSFSAFVVDDDTRPGTPHGAILIIPNPTLNTLGSYTRRSAAPHLRFAVVDSSTRIRLR
ncbi:hypothetical protein FB446DRAFT_803993 [Lentinula raphanica]|nr:hypothetical protein FB446DRAFT_803993 [Lentinula raphanica]